MSPSDLTGSLDDFFFILIFLASFLVLFMWNLSIIYSDVDKISIAQLVVFKFEFQRVCLN